MDAKDQEQEVRVIDKTDTPEAELSTSSPEEGFTPEQLFEARKLKQFKSGMWKHRWKQPRYYAEFALKMNNGKYYVFYHDLMKPKRPKSMLLEKFQNEFEFIK